ncbi:DUF7162 family protein [Mycolicibacterium phlei]
MEVDVRQLRVVAGRIDDAADQIAGIRWPALESDALTGSAVAGVTTDPLADRLADVAADMRRWADVAHTAADAYDYADRRAGGRLDR